MIVLHLLAMPITLQILTTQIPATRIYTLGRLVQVMPVLQYQEELHFFVNGF